VRGRPQLPVAPAAIGRLIDSYAEGLIEKPEFEPRIADLRRRAARLEAEVNAQQAAEEQVRSLQRVIGQLDLFAAMVHDRLADADWSTKRDIICTLVKRIEVAELDCAKGDKLSAQALGDITETIVSLSA